ncbi:MULTISPECIES: hypothetical protein [unclassified Rhodanobacter]|uniref:hypothetical protein n=1 Tax=unclassified Rhodanobacter TaxID=2621553 RepID=UPI0012902DD4|nr:MULTISPECIES: hypothetical protein [unclassified Rhodanobacter]
MAARLILPPPSLAAALRAIADAMSKIAPGDFFAIQSGMIAKTLKSAAKDGRPFDLATTILGGRRSGHRWRDVKNRSGRFFRNQG